MFCGNCGKMLPDGAKFCAECGAKAEIQGVQQTDNQKTEQYFEPDFYANDVQTEAADVQQSETQQPEIQKPVQTLQDFELDFGEIIPSAPTPTPTSTSTPAYTSASYEAPASTSSASTGFNGQVLSMGNKQEVVLFHAKTFDDAAKAADELRKRKAVILNMENVDKALTRRVVDFLSGSVYALDGSVKKIAQCTYLFCPHNMAVVGDLENIQGAVESYI